MGPTNRQPNPTPLPSPHLAVGALQGGHHIALHNLDALAWGTEESRQTVGLRHPPRCTPWREGMALVCGTVRSQQVLTNRIPATAPPTRVELLVEGGNLGGEQARHEAVLGEHLPGEGLSGEADFERQSG